MHWIAKGFLAIAVVFAFFVCRELLFYWAANRKPSKGKTAKQGEKSRPPTQKQSAQSLKPGRVAMEHGK